MTTSAEFYEGVAPEHRTYSVLDRMVREETGEAVETYLRTAWPRPNLPDVVEGWIDEVEPDVFFIWVNPFWFSYASFPMLLERKATPLKKQIHKLSRKAATTNWRMAQKVVKVARKVGTRTIGAAYYHEPAYIVDTVEATIRRVLRHEDVIPVVYLAPGCIFYASPKGDPAWNEDRRRKVAEGLRSMCAQLHVFCFAPDETVFPENAQSLIGSEGLHPSAAGHAYMANQQLPVYLSAVRTLRESRPVSSVPG